MSSSAEPTSDYSRPPEMFAQPAVTAARVVAIVLVSSFGGGLAGGIMGFLMGTFLPDFYRSGMFGVGGATDTVQLGTGLGISEGLGLGFVLGVLVVLVMAFGKRRTNPQ